MLSNKYLHIFSLLVGIVKHCQRLTDLEIEQTLLLSHSNFLDGKLNIPHPRSDFYYNSYTKLIAITIVLGNMICSQLHYYRGDMHLKVNDATDSVITSILEGLSMSFPFESPSMTIYILQSASALVVCIVYYEVCVGDEKM